MHLERPQRLGKENRGIGNQRNTRDPPEHSIVEIGKNTQQNCRDSSKRPSVKIRVKMGKQKRERKRLYRHLKRQTSEISHEKYRHG